MCQSSLDPELAEHYIVKSEPGSCCPVPAVCTKKGNPEWTRNGVLQPPVSQTPANSASLAAGPEGSELVPSKTGQSFPSKNSSVDWECHSASPRLVLSRRNEVCDSLCC